MVGPGGTAAALRCRWHGRLARRPAGGAGDPGGGGPPGGAPAVTRDAPPAGMPG
jgi:hypothetical protein